MPKYEIISHGGMYSDYFQGCGVSWTTFDHVATGCGYTAKDAYEDAVEDIYQSHEYEAVQALKLPKRPRGIRQRDHVPARSEGCYWYVSIRYSF